MVTEFAAYHDRFPQTWEAGLCRDVRGPADQRCRGSSTFSTGASRTGGAARDSRSSGRYLEERVAARSARRRPRPARGRPPRNRGRALPRGLLLRSLRRGLPLPRPRLPRDRPRVAGVRAGRRGAARAGPPAVGRVVGLPAARRRRVHGRAPGARREGGRAAGCRCRRTPASSGRTTSRTTGRSTSSARRSSTTRRPSASTDRPLFAYRLADAMGRPLAATASGAGLGLREGAGPLGPRAGVDRRRPTRPATP